MDIVGELNKTCHKEIIKLGAFGKVAVDSNELFGRKLNYSHFDT